MLDCKSMATPMVLNQKKLSESSSNSDLIDPTMYRQLIGSLMYLVNTRPDICYAVSALSQFMSQPRHLHWVVVKHVLRYLRDTVGYGLTYSSSIDMRLKGYDNSDWVRRAPLGVASVWGLPWFPGVAGSRLMWLCVP
jgi:hypothetical protein